MNDLIIRCVKDSELRKCADVVQIAFNEIAQEYGFAKEVNSVRILETLQDSFTLKNKMIAAFLAEELIGFVRIDDKDPEIYEVLNLSVLPEYQSQGVGHALLAKAHEHIAGSGGVAIVCTIIDKNKRLKKWLLTRGFYEQAVSTLDALPASICLLQKDINNSRCCENTFDSNCQ